MNKQGRGKIEYCDFSWSPVTGCTKGCEYCWARRFAKRSKCPDCRTFIPHIHSERLDQPLRVKKSSRIGVSFMGDLFDPGIHDDWLWGVWETMYEAQQHTFLVLTKQPARMREWCAEKAPKFFDMTFWGGPINVLNNIHLGVSVTCQADADERIPILLDTPAAVRWVSLEPMVGPIDLERFLVKRAEGSSLSWVVVGSMSGPKAKSNPCNIEWVRSVIKQCKESEVACFVKQIQIDGKVSHNPDEWPQELRVRKYPAQEVSP